MGQLYDWYSGWREGGIEGLELGFANRLFNMLDNMPEELKPYVTIQSGYRSIEAQQKLWDDKVAEVGETEARKWVAPPGRSNHQGGLAADIQMTDPRARAWVHQNASTYGLNFPMEHEPWHIEPAGLRDGTFQQSGQTYQEGYEIDGKNDGAYGSTPDAEAYTDGLGIPEIDNSSLEVQLLRLTDLMASPNQTGANQLQISRPEKLAEMNTGIEGHELA